MTNVDEGAVEEQRHSEVFGESSGSVHSSCSKIPEAGFGRRYFIFSSIFFVLAAFLGAISDIVTKNWVFSWLGLPGEYREVEPEGVYWLLSGMFGFQTSLNGGGLFGMWQGQSFPLAILSCLALLGICFWFFCVAWRSQFMAFTLGIIAAGILGNLYDRLGFHSLVWGGDSIYAVRDWILVMIGTYHWPNFNLADSFLVCGTILILLQPFFEWAAKKMVYRKSPKCKKISGKGGFDVPC
ncbi:MAG: signal peptidase II [Planctomycetaceae bacterium]|jgi:signal peptidase II|nr:signal peptidase II [Planctomycetaceae bacterium]